MEMRKRKKRMSSGGQWEKRPLLRPPSPQLNVQQMIKPEPAAAYWVTEEADGSGRPQKYLVVESPAADVQSGRPLRERRLMVSKSPADQDDASVQDDSVHSDHPIGEGAWSCPLKSCRLTFETRAALSKHKKYWHRVGRVSKPESEKHILCKYCDYRTYRNKYINRHVRIKHPNIDAPNITTRKFVQPSWQCNMCPMSLATKGELKLHFAQAHNKPICKVSFHNELDFQKWFNLLEEEASVHFVRSSSNQTRAYLGFVVRYMQCQESGNPSPTKVFKGGRALKQISIKLGFACSCFIVIRRYETGRVDVEYCPEHNHNVRLNKMTVPHQGQMLMAKYIRAGYGVEWIVNKCKALYPDPKHRLHVVSKADVHAVRNRLEKYPEMFVDLTAKTSERTGYKGPLLTATDSAIQEFWQQPDRHAATDIDEGGLTTKISAIIDKSKYAFSEETVTILPNSCNGAVVSAEESTGSSHQDFVAEAQDKLLFLWDAVESIDEDKRPQFLQHLQYLCDHFTDIKP